MLMRKEKAVKFMRQAHLLALEHSKDPSTKVGAIVLGPRRFEVRSTGYNGMPHGCDDNNEKRLARPEKYLWFEHAERNAFYNAARVGMALEDCILVCTLFPCMDCARGIVQAGLRGVIAMEPNVDLETWGTQFAKSLELFEECSITVETLRFPEVFAPGDALRDVAWEKCAGIRSSEKK